MAVKLKGEDRALVLDLLHKLQLGTLSTEEQQPSPATSSDEPMSEEERRKKSVKEALRREKARSREDAKRLKAQEKLLKAAFSAEKAANSVGAKGAARPASAKQTTSVRLGLCTAANTKDQKIVVFKRADGLPEVLKTAKSKLKMKKLGKAATLLDGTVVQSISELDDGAVLVIHLDNQPAPEPTEDLSATATEGESATQASNEDIVASLRKAWTQGGMVAGMRVPLTSEEAAKEQQRLLASARCPTAATTARTALPAYQYQAHVMEILEAHPTMMLVGETGCGKTTQLPQLILDHHIEAGKGGQVNIVCTQPRRVAAMTVAARVAEERGEQVGQTVGYAVRGEALYSKHTRVLFCTTGVLLRMLAETWVGSSSGGDGGGVLGAVTHILVDEVHERSMLTDFLLILLRDHAAKAGAPRIVLMSATADSELFSRYMGGCPTVSIPGRTFPVQERYLEDAIQSCRFCPQEHTKKGSKSIVPASQWAKPGHLGPGYDQETQAALRKFDLSEVNYELIVRLIEHICRSADSEDEGNSGEGAILVFLSGQAEVNQLVRLLAESKSLGNIVSVLPLYGALPFDQQRKVFTLRPGVRKIVVSTNIAETSVTIPEVTHVIDTGRVKEMCFQHEHQLHCMREAWISRASAKQRQGRAGRVRMGTVYRLWPRSMPLEDHTVPELLRSPLEELILQAAMMGITSPQECLLSALQAPAPAAVYSAVQTLLDLQAVSVVSGRLQLTPIGFHLASLPVDAHLGKMLLLGCVCQCLDPVLIIVAAMTNRSPFFVPESCRDEASSKIQTTFGTQESDYLARAAAYTQWLEAKESAPKQATKLREHRSCEYSDSPFHCGSAFSDLDTLLACSGSSSTSEG